MPEHALARSEVDTIALINRLVDRDIIVINPELSMEFQLQVAVASVKRNGDLRDLMQLVRETRVGTETELLRCDFHDGAIADGSPIHARPIYGNCPRKALVRSKCHFLAAANRDLHHGSAVCVVGPIDGAPSDSSGSVGLCPPCSFVPTL